MNDPNGGRGRRMSEKIHAWMDGTMTRRRFLPAYVVLVFAVAGAFALTARQGSRFDEAQVRIEVERCLDSIERSDGLRFNLNEIYDVLGFIVDEIAVGTSGNDESIARLRMLTALGRSEIDERYPPREPDDCILDAGSGG